MGQVTVTLNGRTYRLSCGAGEEPRLLQLAEHVKERIDALATEFGHAGDDRLLLMAALLATDELFDARDRLMALSGQRAAIVADPAERADGPPTAEVRQLHEAEAPAVAAARSPAQPARAQSGASTRMPRPLAGHAVAGAARQGSGRAPAAQGPNQGPPPAAVQGSSREPTIGEARRAPAQLPIDS